MSNDYFQFKQFLVKQERSVFKVGTDGVLLGAWATVDDTESILDIGTGTGLIALMLAQRTEAIKQSQKANARIVALEIERASYEEALENVQASPWNDRITVISQSFQDYSRGGPGIFDLIVTNPPFYRGSLKPQNYGKEISRHDTSLRLTELVSGMPKLLSQDGKFCVILPVEESEKVQQLGRLKDLFLVRMLLVRPTEKLPVKRHLLEFRRSPALEPDISEIVIEGDARHEYTEPYRELTRDFYLAF